MFKVLLRNLRGEQRKSTKTSIKIAGVLTEIRSKHFPNRSSNHYKYTNMLDNFFVVLSGAKLSPLYCDHYWSIVPAPDDGDCGAVSGMKIGRRNRSTRRKPASVPLCSPQIPHDLTWARTWAATVGSRQLTA
jgi:hypothetical protein